jgi:predicted RecA/RadA family phage recombinase
MAKNFVQPGKQVTFPAPVGGVVTGVGVLIGAMFGVALTTAAAGLDFVAAMTGVWDLDKVAAEAWLVGDKIFWNDTLKKCTNAAAAGLRFIGTATAVAANPTNTGRVRLEGKAALLEDDSLAAPASHADAGAVVLTAGEILGGIVVADPNGAGRNYTLPTAALLVAALAGARVGDVIRCYMVNGADAAEAITLLAGAGGAFDANQTAASRVIGQNTSKLVHIRLTNVTPAAEAYVAYA